MKKEVRKKVLVLFGTRPEAIKLAPIIREFEENLDYFETKVCITSQHKEILQQVLDIFGVRVDFDLDIMEEAQTLFQITSKILLRLEAVLDEFKPDLVLVHGDTTTTFASALGAFYKKIKIAHVEAGLRSFDIYHPFPEEANRKLTSSITNFFFAPTENSQQNLINEGVKKSQILVTGNSIIDALNYSLSQISSSLELQNRILNSIEKSGFKISKSRRFILVTAHRRESFGKSFLEIIEAIREIANLADVDILYPVHPNPEVKNRVYEHLGGVKNIYLIKPVDYFSFIYLMSRAYLILSDSGGVQEEAPSLNRPLLLLRDTTERPEVIKSGAVKVVGTKRERIISETLKLLSDKKQYQKMAKAKNPYGDGKTAKRIVKFLRENL